MGVKFGREYADIISDLSTALEPIEGLNGFFYMDTQQWNDLSSSEKAECLRTLSDDIIYGLGQQPSATIGSGSVEYDKKKHLLKVIDGPRITIVKLI